MVSTFFPFFLLFASMNKSVLMAVTDRGKSYNMRALHEPRHDAYTGHVSRYIGGNCL